MRLAVASVKPLLLAPITTPRVAPYTIYCAEAAWKNSVPNALTVSRVVTIPLLVGAFYWRRTRTARLPAILFALCALTDWLDGYLARKWAVFTDFGAFLDPVADKLLVCTCLALLSGELGPVVALPTALIVSREVAVSALREWMGARGEREAVKVGWWGKVKTAAQMVALQLLLFAVPTSTAPLPLMRIGLALLYLATALTWTSAWGYFAVAAPLLMKSFEGQPPAEEVKEPSTEKSRGGSRTGDVSMMCGKGDGPLEIDAKLVAADTTLVFAYAFARTLSVVLLEPEFPGWLSPIKSDPARLSTTLGFAGQWALAWFISGLVLDTFAPGVDEESMNRVGPDGALKCFSLTAALVLAASLAIGLVTPAGELPPTSLQLNLDNAAGGLGIGLSLVAWRGVIGDLTRFW